MVANVQISRVFHLSDSDLEDCRFIISQSRHGVADSFWYQMNNLSADNWRLMFTACTPHLIVGLIMGYVKDMAFERHATLDFLFVDERVRRNNIGARLLNQFENEARVKNVAQIDVQSVSGAVPFYQRHGYAVVDGCMLSKRLER